MQSATPKRLHALLLTPGNVHDCKVERLRIEALPPATELVATKVMTGQALHEWLNELLEKHKIRERAWRADHGRS
jgi:IS5 family transposase